MNKVVLSFVVPLASFIMVAVFAVVLGYVFYEVHHHTEMGTAGVIVIGLVLLIGTPVIAYLLERATEK
jgi:multisubunit Na+/H+ antiporter MnhG subunit